MEIAALPKTIEGFLDSLLPALTQSIIFIAFVVFFVGVAPATNWLKARVARLTVPEALATDPFIKESGLLKLVPIGLLVAVLLLAITLDRTVSFVGFKIPGQLSYSEPDVLVQAVPKEHLAKLWALFPAAEEEHMLYLELEYQVSTVPAPASSRVRLPWEYHDDEFSVGARSVTSIKFYLALGLLICLVRKRLGLQGRNVWGRYLATIIVASILITFFVIQQIHEKEQSDWAKVNYIVAKQVAGGSESEIRLRDQEAQAKFAERLNAYRDRHKRDSIHAFYLRP